MSEFSVERVSDSRFFNTPKIKIDNVVNFVKQEQGDVIWDFDTIERHVPKPLPPFNDCLLYYSYGAIRFRVTVYVFDLMKQENQAYKKSLLKQYNAHNQNIDTSEIRFAVQQAYETQDTMSMYDYLFICGWLLNEDGTFGDSMIGRSVTWVNPDYEKAVKSDGITEKALTGWIIQHSVFVDVAFSFMHCKNVELIDEHLSRQRRRKLERKGGIRYKVLDIEPFKKQVRRETQPGESQLQRALHICRGHFATYTEDKPLFGKHTGTYWKPMHVRGNKGQGEVVKDYNIVLDDVV